MHDSDGEAEEAKERGANLFVALCAGAFILIAGCAAYIAITWNG